MIDVTVTSFTFCPPAQPYIDGCSGIVMRKQTKDYRRTPKNNRRLQVRRSNQHAFVHLGSFGAHGSRFHSHEPKLHNLKELELAHASESNHHARSRQLGVGLPLHPIATEMFQDGRTDPGGDDDLRIHPFSNACSCIMQPALVRWSHSQKATSLANLN